MELNVGGRVIQFLRGDITAVAADALVNAANPGLLGGMGVDGAIHRVGGPSILEECRDIVARKGKCRPGEAVMTGAGSLPARHVIHTVGPIWRGGTAGEAEVLASAYRNSLALAADQGLGTIAFPSISTGAYGYPVAEAARIALGSVLDFLQSGGSIRKVIFALFDEAAYQAYLAAAARLQPAQLPQQPAGGMGTGVSSRLTDRQLKVFRRCQEAIHAAETLLEESLYAESISRAYYAVIHAVMLFLSGEGTETRNPVEAENIFTETWVAQRKLPTDLFSLFESIRRAKKGFPHNYLYTYSGEDAREITRQARRFLDLTRDHFDIVA